MKYCSACGAVLLPSEAECPYCRAPQAMLDRRKPADPRREKASATLAPDRGRAPGNQRPGRSSASRRPIPPVPNHWGFVWRIPMDHVRRAKRACPQCKRETTQDQYRMISGRWVGAGAPWFLRPFLYSRRSPSTSGKIGQRSLWYTCAECGSLMPDPNDASSVNEAKQLGWYPYHAFPKDLGEPIHYG
jgi:RNA polymerase subunit RPABC4/transcription elongation factor Spt4